MASLTPDPWHHTPPRHDTLLMTSQNYPKHQTLPKHWYKIMSHEYSLITTLRYLCTRNSPINADTMNGYLRLPSNFSKLAKSPPKYDHLAPTKSPIRHVCLLFLVSPQTGTINQEKTSVTYKAVFLWQKNNIYGYYTSHVTVTVTWQISRDRGSVNSRLRWQRVDNWVVLFCLGGINTATFPVTVRCVLATSAAPTTTTRTVVNISTPTVIVT